MVIVLGGGKREPPSLGRFATSFRVYRFLIATVIAVALVPELFRARTRSQRLTTFAVISDSSELTSLHSHHQR